MQSRAKREIGTHSAKLDSGVHAGDVAGNIVPRSYCVQIFSKSYTTVMSRGAAGKRAWVRVCPPTERTPTI